MSCTTNREGKRHKKQKHIVACASVLRYLADSNCRTRFCRPLTKPLIQGTVLFRRTLLFLDCGCKGNAFFLITNYPQHFFFDIFWFLPQAERFSSYNLFMSQPVTQFAHGLFFSFIRRKNIRIRRAIQYRQHKSSSATTHSCQWLIATVLPPDAQQRLQSRQALWCILP